MLVSPRLIFINPLNKYLLSTYYVLWHQTMGGGGSSEKTSSYSHGQRGLGIIH